MQQLDSHSQPSKVTQAAKRNHQNMPVSVCSNSLLSRRIFKDVGFPFVLLYGSLYLQSRM